MSEHEWRENAALKRENEELKKQRSHLLAILGVLNTDNEIASLHNYELWSIHGDLQKTITAALLTDTQESE